MTAAKRKKQNLRRSVSRLQDKVDRLCNMCDRAIRDMSRVRDFAEAQGREFGDVQTRRMAEAMHQRLSMMVQPIVIHTDGPPTDIAGGAKARELFTPVTDKPAEKPQGGNEGKARAVAGVRPAVDRALAEMRKALMQRLGTPRWGATG